MEVRATTLNYFVKTVKKSSKRKFGFYFGSLNSKHVLLVIVLAHAYVFFQLHPKQSVKLRNMPWNIILSIHS